MKKFCLLLLGFGFALTLQAADMIYLNDGSTVKGTVIESGEGVVKVRLDNDSIIELNEMEVKTIDANVSKPNPSIEPREPQTEELNLFEKIIQFFKSLF